MNWVHIYSILGQRGYSAIEIGHMTMNQIRALISVIILAVIVGCQMPDLNDTKKPLPDKPDIVVAGKAEASWKAIADAAAAKQVLTSTRLSRVVIGMAKMGRLSKADVQKFDELFPKIAQTERDLTDEDIAKLRTLSQ